MVKEATITTDEEIIYQIDDDDDDDVYIYLMRGSLGGREVMFTCVKF